MTENGLREEFEMEKDTQSFSFYPEIEAVFTFKKAPGWVGVVHKNPIVLQFASSRLSTISGAKCSRSSWCRINCDWNEPGAGRLASDGEGDLSLMRTRVCGIQRAVVFPARRLWGSLSQAGVGSKPGFGLLRRPVFGGRVPT